ncbi:hypothetical protein DICVIV_04134 [Dictyocaulus viviparus]|uniref:Uncharacterized protein n=1 Tax=Dictyocaulus viviparus TaxID=29172 RepID=A0A0D8XYK8_DICVI|nr:hypothetical protein DICVIV_04134 [Dictyocaulus viviparus]
MWAGEDSTEGKYKGYSANVDCHSRNRRSTSSSKKTRYAKSEVFSKARDVILERNISEGSHNTMTLGKRPMRMKSADISAAKFQHGGVLVLDSRLKGPVKHALENQPTVSLHTLQFDSKLNEIVDIGSDVEIINDKGMTTTVLTEAEPENEKAAADAKNCSSGKKVSFMSDRSFDRYSIEIRNFDDDDDVARQFQGEPQTKTFFGARKAMENKVPETGSMMPRSI